MRHPALAALLALFLLTGSMSAGAQQSVIVPQAKRAVIDELLITTGFNDGLKVVMGQLIDVMLAAMLQNNPDLPQEVRTIVHEEIGAAFEEEIGSQRFQEMMYPIYSRHFTLGELQAMVRFYKTPVGQKSIRLMPLLNQEGMAAGQRWAQEIMPKVMQRLENRLRAEGHI